MRSREAYKKAIEAVKKIEDKELVEAYLGLIRNVYEVSIGKIRADLSRQN